MLQAAVTIQSVDFFSCFPYKLETFNSNDLARSRYDLNEMLSCFKEEIKKNKKSIYLYTNYRAGCLGPVVQNIVSLTSSLVVKMLTVLVSTIPDSQVFLLKKCE